MPVSGFPNQTAYVIKFPATRSRILTMHFHSATQEDEMGVLYLSNIDFLKVGVPASVISALVSGCIVDLSLWRLWIIL